jgi:hypothetical protein
MKRPEAFRLRRIGGSLLFDRSINPGLKFVD